MAQPKPEDEPEAHKPSAAQRRSNRIECGEQSTPIGAISADATLVYFLVCFDKAGSGRKDGREGEKETTDCGSIFFSDQTGRNADRSSEDEADDPFVRTNALDCGEAGVNDHDLF